MLCVVTFMRRVSGMMLTLLLLATVVSVSLIHHYYYDIRVCMNHWWWWILLIRLVEPLVLIDWYPTIRMKPHAVVVGVTRSIANVVVHFMVCWYQETRNNVKLILTNCYKGFVILRKNYPKHKDHYF